MTLLERLKEKREQRKIWKPRKPKKITPAQKLKNKLAADGIATAIQRHMDKELIQAVEDQAIIADAFKRAFAREPLLTASTVTIQYNTQEVQNANVIVPFKIKPAKPSTPDD
jgi:hypothetical protein